MGKIKSLWGGERTEAPACKLCGTFLVEEGNELNCPHCGFMAGRESYVFNIPDQGGRKKEREEKEAPATTPIPVAENMLDAALEKRGEPPVGVGLGEDEEDPGPAMSIHQELETNGPNITLDLPGLLALLAKQPALLEPGLRLVTDKNQKPIGAGLSTPVGDIDLLARDGSGAFVVVSVAVQDHGGDLVAATLQRVGWVRKHLAKGKQKVRGIILVQQVPEDLGYSVAALAGAVAIKTYRVAVAFDDVEL